MENSVVNILPFDKNLLYYNMKKAYEKALKVIDSCMNSSQTMSAYNYIWIFNRLFIAKKQCKELTRILLARCAKKRKMVENK